MGSSPWVGMVLPYWNGPRTIIMVNRSEPDGHGGYLYDVTCRDQSGRVSIDVNVQESFLDMAE